MLISTPPNPKQVTAEGTALYADSIESLVRNKIQALKIDMANEVIDAGRFDMQTSMAERRETLEQMLQARMRAHGCQRVYGDAALSPPAVSLCMLLRKVAYSDQQQL